MKKLCVVIPTKNEQKGIVQVINAMPRSELEALRLKMDVLVVDGNSSDETRKKALELGAFVELQQGAGKGDAVQAAFNRLKREKYDFAVMIDGDNTYDARQIPEVLFPVLTDRCDVVIGSRQITKESMDGINRLGNKMLSSLANATLTRTEDLCSGFWAFNSKAIKEMQPSAEGFDIEADLLAETRKKRLRTCNVPVSYGKRTGESKLSPWTHGLLILGRIIRNVRDWNPLILFGSIGVALLMLAAIVGMELVPDLMRGVIVKVPRLIVTGFLILFAFSAIGYGLVLDYIERTFKKA